MDVFTSDDLAQAIIETSSLMDANKERLIQLDSVMGDADLGLTMSKGFSVASECAQELEDTNIAVRFKKIGFSLAKAVPSTMGTLMATAFIGVGNKIELKESLQAADIGEMFLAMADSIQQRGKAEEGDKTILDVLFPVARAVLDSDSQDITQLMRIALETAKESLEKTKDMMSQHGKAAVFREKTIGMIDPGAAAVTLLIEGFAKACKVGENNED